MQKLRKLLIEKLGGFASAEDALAALDTDYLVHRLGSADSAIRKLGGFPTIEDAIEEIRDKDLVQRKEILTLAVKKLFNTIGADDILHVGKEGQWMLEGKAMSKGTQDLLIAEAHGFENSTLWKVFQKDVLYLVNKKLFIHSENDMHVVTAKFWLYTFDTIRTRLKSLAAGSAVYNKTKGQK